MSFPYYSSDIRCASHPFHAHGIIILKDLTLFHSHIPSPYPACDPRNKGHFLAQPIQLHNCQSAHHRSTIGIRRIVPWRLHRRAGHCASACSRAAEGGSRWSTLPRLRKSLELPGCLCVVSRYLFRVLSVPLILMLS